MQQINQIKLYLILSLFSVFFILPKLHSQCIYQVSHVSGTQLINGTQVTVIPAGLADSGSYYCSSTKPYLIGANYVTPGLYGSYTFRFSPAVSSIQLNFSGLHNQSIHKEIVILTVNGSHYKIPTAGDTNGCDALATLTPNGNITGHNLGYGSGWNNTIIIDSIYEIIVLDTVITGTPNGAFFSLYISDRPYGIDTITSCNSIKWIDSNTYSSSITTPVFNIAGGAASGCDSLVKLDLRINTDLVIDTQSACRSYTWIDGNTYTSTNYTAKRTFTNSFGCDSVINLNLTIDTVNTSVTHTGLLLTADKPGAAYQWLDCAGMTSISGAVNQSYLATISGNYAVIVTVNGCSDTSACYAVSSTWVKENDFNNEFLLYPNPSNGIFIFDFKRMSADQVDIYIFDAVGKLVKQIKNTENKEVIDLTDCMNGVYFFKVVVGERVKRIRVIKQD